MESPCVFSFFKNDNNKTDLAEKLKEMGKASQVRVEEEEEI